MYRHGLATKSNGRSQFLNRRGKITFTQTQSNELLPRMLACGVFAGWPATRVAPPRIHSRSRHCQFAVHVLAGYPYEEACRVLGINPRTAERWRTDLRNVAADYFGRRVTYEFAARFALDPTLRAACDDSPRGSPH